MAAKNSFKKQLAMTTALVATFVTGYARQADAACNVTTGSNYLCTGVTTGVQTITMDNATITTDSTFDFDGGFIIAGAGAISFTDTYGVPLMGAGSGFSVNITGDDGATAGSLNLDLAGDVNFAGGAIGVINKGTGDVNIKAGDVLANRHNIFVNTYGSGVTIDVKSIQQLLPQGGSNWAGIEVQNRGTGGISIDIENDVTNETIGISATNFSGDNVVINVGGDITSGGFGIVSGNYGTGSSHVYVGGSVNATNNIGIRFRSFYTTEGDKSVIVRGDVTSVNAMALQARNNGLGHLLVDVGGKVQGASGIQANSGAGGMTVNVHDVVATTGEALYLLSGGTMTVTATGDIEGSVRIANWSGLTDVTLHNFKTNASGGGISVNGYDVNFTAVTGVLGGYVGLSAGQSMKANVAKVVSAYDGISTSLWGSSELSLRVGDVTAGGNGVRVSSEGTMDVFVTGDIDAAGDFGLMASAWQGLGGSVTVAAGASVSGDTGVRLASYYGQDALALNVHGTIEGRAGNAILVEAGYRPAGKVDINIHGGRIIGDVIQQASYSATQYAAYCQANPSYCYSYPFIPTVGDARVTVAGDFTSEGNFDVSSFAVAKGVVFTAGAATSITTSVDPVDVAGTFRVNAASSSVNSDLRITGGLLDIREDFTVAGALRNSGAVAITHGKTLTVDTMASASGGTLSFGIASATDHGLLVVTNGAADLTGQKVVVNLDPAATLNAGDQIMIIDGTGSVTGGPPAGGVKVSSNSPLWEFRMVNGAGITDDSDIFLTLAKAAPPKPVGNIIAATTLTFADTAMNLTGERLSMMRHHGTTGVSAGEAGADDGGTRVWTQALGQRVHQGMRQGIAGYGAHLLGGTIGVDTDKFLDKGVLGVAFSYGESRINAQNTTRTDTNIDSYQLTFYGDYNWDNGVYVDGMGAYAFNRNKTIRHGAGGAGLDARANFDSYNTALRGEVGRVYSMGSAFVTPFALANWVYYNIDDYSETGGGGGNLNVSSKSLNQIDLGLGAKAGMTMASINGSLVVPELNVAYRRDMLNNNLSTTQTYVAGGPVYAVDGPTPARDKLTLGARVKYFDSDGLELGIAYDFDIKQDYTAHTGYVRAGVRF